MTNQKSCSPVPWSCQWDARTMGLTSDDPCCFCCWDVRRNLFWKHICSLLAEILADQIFHQWQTIIFSERFLLAAQQQKQHGSSLVASQLYSWQGSLFVLKWVQFVVHNWPCSSQKTNWNNRIVVMKHEDLVCFLLQLALWRPQIKSG